MLRHEWLTPVELDMQMHLFDGVNKRATTVSDLEMWRVLRNLRNCSEFDSFRLWLIGSRTTRGKEESDIDVLLSPLAGSFICDLAVERALWRCRDYGLRTAPLCRLDVCFRAEGPTVCLEALNPDMTLTTVKLFSPKLARDVISGRIREYRRLGYFSIEFHRRAGDTGYYRKLPKHSFDGLLAPYLRPAIEIVGRERQGERSPHETKRRPRSREAS